MVSCMKCGGSQARDVINHSINQQHCVNCGNSLNQHTNAILHTVNQNRSVVAAHVTNIYWQPWYDKFEVSYDLDIINSVNQPVVIKLVLSKFNKPAFFTYEQVARPKRQKSLCQGQLKVSASNFPEQPGLVSVDFEVYNLWGDFLAKSRELMKYRMEFDLITMGKQWYG